MERGKQIIGLLSILPLIIIIGNFGLTNQTLMEVDSKIKLPFIDVCEKNRGRIK